MLTNRPRVRRVVTDETLADISTMLQALNGYSSELVSVARGMQMNSVLWSGTVRLDANGQWSESWVVPFAAIGFWPASTGGAITMQAAPASLTPPAHGVGVWLFPIVGANEVRGRVFPALGQTLTVYGTPSAIAGQLAVYSRPQPPA